MSNTGPTPPPGEGTFPPSPGEGDTMAGMAKHASPAAPPAPGNPFPLSAVVAGARGRPWPLLLIAVPAAVAVWSGWVGLAALCGFGLVHPLPGIAPGVELNTAITLPVGIESYGAYALYACLASASSQRTRKFAAWSAAGALVLGCLGQVSYHLLVAFHVTRPPVIVVVGVACLPVITLFFAAALAHMMLADARAERERREAAEARKLAAASARADRGTGTSPRNRKQSGTRTRKPRTAAAGTKPAGSAAEPEAGELPSLEDEARIMAIMDQGYNVSQARVLLLIEKGNSPSAAGKLAGKSDSFGRQVARLAADAKKEPAGDARSDGDMATGEQPKVGG